MMTRGRTAVLAFVPFVCVRLAGFAQEPAPAPPNQPAPPQIVRTLSFSGVSLFPASELSNVLEVREGAVLPDEPETLARRLRDYYADEGYTAARVTAQFDATDGRLSIAVDEGVIQSLDIAGVGESRARELADAFDVQPGRAYNRYAVQRALERLLAPAKGALEPAAPAATPAGTIVADDVMGAQVVDVDGRLTLRLQLRPRTGRVSFIGGGRTREDWYDPVDGFAPTIGFGTTIYDQRRFNHTYVEGTVIYRFAPERPGYSLGASRPLFGGPRLFIGGDIHDLTDSDDRWRLTSMEQSLVSLSFRDTYRDYYRRRGYQVNTALQLSDSNELSVAWRDDRHESLANATSFAFWRDDHPFRPNPPISEGRMKTIVVGYSWDTRGFDTEHPAQAYVRHLMDDLYGSRAVREPGLRLEATAEIADAASLGGDFSFVRYIINARTAVWLSPRQTLNGRVMAGWCTGTLPIQREFALGGIGSVRGYSFKEVVGERMALVNVEYGVRLGRSRALLLFDAGRIGRALYGSSTDWLTGVGIGWELRDGIRLEIGWRLDDIPDSFQPLVRLSAPF
jgi:outer membrane protein assembly factor BamA